MSLDKGKSRDAIKAEWEAVGMRPRIQSPAEMRRVLMTWTKDEIITAAIRAEDEAIKAREDMLRAWHETQAVRQNVLYLPRETKRHEFGSTDPFEAWLKERQGQNMRARDVFMEGWRARARADETFDPDSIPADGRDEEIR